MFFRFLVQINSVIQLISKSEITKGDGYYLASCSKEISPFTFWKYIVLNANKYSKESYSQIIEHEKVHVGQHHTFDLIFAELFLILQWFNPLAWWHRQLIAQNLEFLVDQTLLGKGENRLSYQYHLLDVASPYNTFSISSNYNSLQIKKRIKMMNLKRSSHTKIWKYTLIVPMSFILLASFTSTSHKIENTSEANEIFTNTESDASDAYVIITEDASEDNLKVLQEQLYQIGFVLSFDKLSYENNKIKDLEVVLNYRDKEGLSRRAGCIWNEESPSPKVALLVNTQSRFGNFALDIIMMDNIATKIPKEEIFIAGDLSMSIVMDQMKNQYEAQQDLIKKQRQENLKNPKWKGEKMSSARFYGPVITSEDISQIKDLIQRKGYPTTYYLDGIKHDASILDMPINEIESIVKSDFHFKIFDKNGKFLKVTPWNYEVKIERKGKLK